MIFHHPTLMPDYTARCLGLVKTGRAITTAEQYKTAAFSRILELVDDVVEQEGFEPVMREIQDKLNLFAVEYSTYDVATAIYESDQFTAFVSNVRQDMEAMDEADLREVFEQATVSADEVAGRYPDGSISQNELSDETEEIDFYAFVEQLVVYYNR